MCRNFLLVVMVLYYHNKLVSTIPLSVETTVNTLETSDEVADLTSRTTDRNILEERQTEAIKRISAEHLNIAPEYRPITKYQPQRETENLSLEQLKIKCQHLSRLIEVNRTNQIIPNRPTNHKYPEVHARPVYYPTRATFRPVKYPPTSKPHGFYITSQPSTTKNPPTTTAEQPTTPVKYIRLEPVILQKTILADGRTVYLWHKSLPTAVEYAPNNQPEQTKDQSAYHYGNQNKFGYSPQHGYYYDPSQYLYGKNYPNHSQATSANEIGQHVTTESTTTTTTEDSNSYGYGFSNFIPFYRYRQDSSISTTKPSTTTTTTTTTAAPTTTTKSQTDTVSDILYAQQLKFVVPIPVNEYGTIPAKDPWTFDPYAYYPKPLQPNSLNLQAPYNPIFHVIKAVKVPSLENKRNLNTK